MEDVKGGGDSAPRVRAESASGDAATPAPSQKADTGAKPVMQPATQEPPASGVYEVRGELAGKQKKYVGSGRDMDARLADSRHPARELVDKGENVTITQRPVDVSDAPTPQEANRILRTNEQLSMDEVAQQPGESLNKIRARAPEKFARDLPKYGDRRQEPRPQPTPTPTLPQPGVTSKNPDEPR